MWYHTVITGEQAPEQKKGTAMPTNPTAIPDRTVFIGDNLDVLRGLDSESVNLIYLDPPFNSNRTYEAPIGSKAAGAAFQDTWNLSDVDLAWHGQIADRNPALYEIIRSSRLAHGDGMMSYLIMMGVRLIELKRVLKPSGSIYLHCDDTASHYLKLVMDAVFGREWYKNEIVWKRTAGRSDAKKFGRVHDIILYYAGPGAVWNTQWQPHSPGYAAKYYRNKDSRGQWQGTSMIAPGTSRGESGMAWNNYDPGLIGQHWRTPTKGGMSNWIRDNVISGWPHGYPSVHDRLNALDEAGLIYWPRKKGGQPRLKRYLASTKGTAVTDIFSDINKLEAKSKEKVGYPTQKPLALLDRIIKASTNEGDVVLDPFAGCATACVAAERLNRKWIGIDLSAKAGEMIQLRLEKDLGLASSLATVRTDIPVRTDLEDDPRTDRQVKEALYGAQEGNCNGCQHHFPFRNLTRDHIIPRSKGGSDHPSNIQLLCAVCNSMKGTGTHAALLAKLSALPGSIRG